MEEKDYERAYQRIRDITGNFSSMPRENHPMEHGKGIFAILMVLAEGGGSLLSGDIARRTCMGTGRVATAFNVLEAKGLARRSALADDRRKVLVTLTDEGWSYIGRLRSSFRSMLDDLVDSLGKERFLSFLDTYVEISEILKRRNG